MKITLCETLFSIALLFAYPANGDLIAYDNAPSGQPQNYGNNLGLDFDVNAPIYVTQLGVFDNAVIANLDGVASGAKGIDVAIFDRTNTASPYSQVLHFSASSPGTQNNANAFLPLSAPLLLPAGFQGSIVAWNDGNSNSNGVPNASSTLDTSGRLSFVGAGRYSMAAAALGFPGTSDGGPANRYDAGTFAFTVPEPTSSVLFGVGLLLATLFQRCRPCAN